MMPTRSIAPPCGVPRLPRRLADPVQLRGKSQHGGDAHPLLSGAAGRFDDDSAEPRAAGELRERATLPAMQAARWSRAAAQEFFEHANQGACSAQRPRHLRWRDLLSVGILPDVKNECLAVLAHGEDDHPVLAPT